jgi:hypothetical protein
LFRGERKIHFVHYVEPARQYTQRQVCSNRHSRKFRA